MIRNVTLRKRRLSAVSSEKGPDDIGLVRTELGVVISKLHSAVVFHTAPLLMKVNKSSAWPPQHSEGNRNITRRPSLITY
jgi:hypothetical protein